LSLSFHAAAKTDRGVRRRESPNQDNVLAVQVARLHEGKPQAFGLFIVADGMGGHSFGREASSRAIEVMADDILQPLLDGQPLTEEQVLAILKAGAEHANAELHHENLRQHADMGTTVTAALVISDLAHIINVGDSRTYHLKLDQPLIQVTNDHSVVAGLVAAGVIRPEDIYTHPRRNQIYRSLGERDEVQIDTFQVALQPGDRLLLCSDGLWEMVRDPRIEEILRGTGDPHAATEQFIEEANANGGVDNVSAIVVEMTDERSIPSQTGMHYLASPETIKRHPLPRQS
ncbi:MAG TPA: protein phosphatase 2C domain-containing protein, partial [Ktedonobacterales bacterium]|nr:protein phosphatase 2C domain-containing protein [Ktedonobacterales bacterium]